MIKTIKINDLELSPDNGYFLQAIKDLGYKTKYPVGKVLYFHGVKIGDVFFENKLLAFEIIIAGNNLNQLIERRNELIKRLTIKEYEKDLITIEITLINNTKIKAEGYLKEVNTDLSKDDFLTSSVDFILELEEPFLKSSQSYEMNFNITKGGGCEIPMAIPLDLSKGSEGFITVFNGGNIFSYPKIYFYGQLTNPVLINKTINKSISLNLTINNDDYVYIDTYNRIVIDKNNNNVRDKLNGDFLILEKGENQFVLLSDNSLETGYVKLNYNYFYISI